MVAELQQLSGTTLSECSTAQEADERGYRGVVQLIRHWIESGQVKAGEVLPMQQEVARSAGVSIGTVQHAINLLVRERVLDRPFGRGRVHVSGSREPEPASAVAGRSRRATMGPQRLHASVDRVERHGPIVELYLTVVAGQNLVFSIVEPRAGELHIHEGQPVSVHMGSSVLHIRGDGPKKGSN